MSWNSPNLKYYMFYNFQRRKGSWVTFSAWIFHGGLYLIVTHLDITYYIHSIHCQFIYSTHKHERTHTHACKICQCRYILQKLISFTVEVYVIFELSYMTWNLIILKCIGHIIVHENSDYIHLDNIKQVKLKTIKLNSHDHLRQ